MTRIPLLICLCLGVSLARVSGDTFVVTNTNDSGPGSLRQAITEANAHPNGAEVDRIHFDIAGTGVQTITVVSALPDITEGVRLDGWSQPGFQNTPLIELSAASGLAAHGLRIIGGSTHVRGFIINGFRGNQAGISIGPAGGNIIEGCYIGTDKTGLQSSPNGYGISIQQAGINVIGGARNIISGNNLYAIQVNQPPPDPPEPDLLTIKGNYIGTDVTGTQALPNGFPSASAAVEVFCRRAVIGGTAPGEGNLVSGNVTSGINAGGEDILITGNLVGTNVTGSAALPNQLVGVASDDSHRPKNNVRIIENLVSGNGRYGIEAAINDTIIQGNRIGTDLSGKFAIPNATGGVLIYGYAHSLIGGSGTGAGNLISGNLGPGISLVAGRSTLFGNDIPTADNIIQGNRIGVDITGTSALPNSGSGISVVSALRTVIGGSIASARNIISGNLGNGIEQVEGTGLILGCRITGNFIGTGADGEMALGNQLDGIVLPGSGPGIVENNSIAFNLRNGINLKAPVQFFQPQRLSGNSIHDNGLLGIDLGDNGPTLNDPGDGDTGPNELQNFPVVNAAFGFNGNLTIYGSLNSVASKTFTLQFFANQAPDGSGFGEGQVFLGQAQVTTNGSGDAAFNVTFPLPSNVSRVSATAIDSNGNTSEFSASANLSSSAPTAPPTSPTPVTLSTHPAQLLNVSTRLRVDTGENVLIAGFIISGNDPKKIIVRGIGPSLSAISAPARLANPVIELHGSSGLLATNDNWKQDQQTEIENSGIAPAHDLESAIVRTLSPGNYTVVLRGQDSGTGIGVVEAYDLSPAADLYFGNISTRGFVATGDNVMISGFIAAGSGSGNATVAVRGLGPSLASFGVANVLADPTLELRNVNGTLVQSNNEWIHSEHYYEIRATGLQPQDSHEAMILYDVSPGNYTAILRGTSSGTGVGLLEIYNLR